MGICVIRGNLARGLDLDVEEGRSVEDEVHKDHADEARVRDNDIESLGLRSRNLNYKIIINKREGQRDVDGKGHVWSEAG